MSNTTVHISKVFLAIKNERLFRKSKAPSTLKMSVPACNMFLMPEKFLKILECPICYEVPLVTPIFQCVSGHSYCSQCRSKLSQCGLCAKKFSVTRNYSIEALIQAGLFPCKYDNQGCVVTLSGAEMHEHQKTCYYRPIICNDHRVEPCDENPIEIGKLISHLRNKHRCSGFEAELGTYDKTERSSLLKTGPWVLFFMKFDGKYFIKHTQTDEENIYWWISIVGPSEEAQKYNAVIKLLEHKAHSTAQESFYGIEFKTPVHSLRDSFESTANAVPWGCGVLPKAYLKRFCTVFPHVPNKPGSRIDRFEWKMQFQIVKNEGADVVAQLNNLEIPPN